METRRQRLADSLLAQQLFRDVEDEEAWIREKEPVAASTNRGKYISKLFCYNIFCFKRKLFKLINFVGRDLIGVQNLMKKHQAVVAEINNHESRIASVTQTGQQMVDAKHFASEDIKQRLANLNKHWNHLKDKALQV